MGRKVDHSPRDIPLAHINFPHSLMHLSMQIPTYPPPPGIGWGFDTGELQTPLSRGVVFSTNALLKHYKYPSPNPRDLTQSQRINNIAHNYGVHSVYNSKSVVLLQLSSMKPLLQQSQVIQLSIQAVCSFQRATHASGRL